MQAGVRIALAVAMAAVVGLLLGSTLLGAESPVADSPGRYQIANFSGVGVSVLDTNTGAVWSYRIVSDGPGPWRVLAPPIPQQ
jgi:hypothetical protein